MINWFTKLLLKQTEIISLENITYDLKININHRMDDEYVHNTVTMDSQNGNIYDHRLNISNIPWKDKRMINYVRSDFKNVRILYEYSETEIYLLEHVIYSNGNIMVRYPVKFLTNNDLSLKLVVMPLEYEYDEGSVNNSSPLIDVLDAFYEFPSI